jgi:hypothetical protein
VAKTKEWEQFERKRVEGKELTLPLLGYGQQAGSFTKGNKYSGCIKWKEFLDQFSIFSFSKRAKLLGVTVLNISHDCGVVFIRNSLNQFSFVCFLVFFWAYHRVGHDMYLLSTDFHIPSSLYISVYTVSFCVLSLCSFAYWYFSMVVSYTL